MGKGIRSMICGRVHSNVTYSSFGLIKTVTTFLVPMFFFQGKVRLSYVVFECYERFERREEKNKKDAKNRFIAAVYLQV